MHTEKRQTGFTLTEAVSMIIVLGIAIPPLVYLFQQVNARSVDQTFQQVGVAYANSLMEEVVSKSFEDPDAATGSFGTEEGSRAAYDDVDDYDGLNNSPPQELDGTNLSDYNGFTRSVAVDNVTAADPDPITPGADGSSEFKRIRVTVAWTGGKGGECTLTTLRTKPTASSGGSGPLAKGTSEATAAKYDSWRFIINLINNTSSDVEIDSFSLSADQATPNQMAFYNPDEALGLWLGSQALPTGTVNLDNGTSAQRTVPGDGALLIRIGFSSNVSSGPIAFTLVINFTNGSSSTLEFTINW